MNEQDNITKLHSCVKRQFRELHDAVAGDYHEQVSGGYSATGETVALVEKFRPEMRKLALEAMRDARRISITAEVEPIITAVTENQERLYQVAEDAVFHHVSGLPQTIDAYFPTLDRLARVMATLTPQEYEALGVPGQRVTDAPPDAYLSAKQLAERFDVPLRALEALLRRWRENNRASECYHEHDARRVNEPRFTYRLSAMEPMIRDWKNRRAQ